MTDDTHLLQYSLPVKKLPGGDAVLLEDYQQAPNWVKNIIDKSSQFEYSESRRAYYRRKIAPLNLEQFEK